MSQHTVPPTRKAKLPGIDSEATPVLGVGLGLTGLLLGLRPRLAALPLALTALTALLYRDPERHTPPEQHTLFAPSDGQVLSVEVQYEHRFLHTDAVRIAIAASPFDVPVVRSPLPGVIAYLERVPGAYLPVADPRAVEQNERQFIGINSVCGPVLIQITSAPLARRLRTDVVQGQKVRAGERIGVARFGARVDLLLPYDIAEQLPAIGSQVGAGMTRIGHVVAQ
ncbi:phosphatidylserine decarboxylase [Kouleothrix aurantiaca]|uniref:Phosphatidylserine decarboxylase n=1 Tax=Kouleothrix aurantiaca TaxID=186479 RepID=A0A0P9D2H8_9CHLR|nr:phosphatidylserine decarboxylase [Kouleothrix aurantiaca]